MRYMNLLIENKETTTTIHKPKQNDENKKSKKPA